MRTVAAATGLVTQSPGGIEIGEMRFGREIGKLPARHRFVWDSCEVCGKERWVMLIKGMPQRVRCFQCRHGRPMLPRPIATCLNCGCEFTNRQLKHNIGMGWGKFCSQSCSMVWKRKLGLFSRSPNYAEEMLIRLISLTELPFKYVGDGDVWLGNRNPDFINTDGKKQVIELFGRYWHNESDVLDRVEHYNKYGFQTLVIWAGELSKPGDVFSKISIFCGDEMVCEP